jgi:hypothetical protein
MSQTIRRSRAQGLAHRARLAALILPGLRAGQRLPKGICLARLLGINESEAYRHLRRMLAEAGVVTETRGWCAQRGVYVVSIQNWRAAA